MLFAAIWLEWLQAAKHGGSLSIWGFIGLQVHLHNIIHNYAIEPNRPTSLIRH